MIPTLAKSKISRLQLVSVAEKVGLSLTWLQTPETSFLYHAVLNVSKKMQKEWQTVFLQEQIRRVFDDN